MQGATEVLNHSRYTMFRTLTLLLVLTVSMTTVVSISDKLNGWITSSICMLAHGAKDSEDKVDLVGTKCDVNCVIADKLIIFECKNYKQGSVCAAFGKQFAGVIKSSSCEFTCKPKAKTSTIRVTCDSIFYF